MTYSAAAPSREKDVRANTSSPALKTGVEGVGKDGVDSTVPHTS